MATIANWSPYADIVLKVLHNVSALVILAATFVLMGITMSSKSTENSLYLTTSYLASFYTDTPPLAWAPVGDPYHPQRVADTFYDCLYQAQVGFGGDAGCGGTGRDNYDTCINGITASPVYAQKHVANAIHDLIVGYDGDGWDVSAIPSTLTVFNQTQVSEILATSSSKNQLIQTLSASNTILAQSIIKVIRSNPVVPLGVAGCLSTVPQGPGILHDIAPVYDALWQCTSTIVKTTVDAKEAYDQCIPLTAWPTLDVMQTPYSSTFLGCYNKYFVLIIAAWLLTSFAVYTFWVGFDNEATETGKPAHYLSRCGLILSIFCFAWNGLGALVIILVRSFGDQTLYYSFPMSVQTVLITWLFSLLATLYFAREMWEHLFYSTAGSASSTASVENPRPSASSDIVMVAPENQSMATISSSTSTYGVSRVNGGRRYTNLSYFMRVPTKAQVDTEQYTPLLSLAWSDGWVFCDALLVIGIIGTSPDVVTADVVRVFLAVLYGTIIHTAFVRLLYEGYVNDNDSDSNKFRTKKYSEIKDTDEKSRQGIRVMAMLADFGVLMFMIVTWFLLYGRYGGGNSPLVLQYVIVCSNIPTVFWLVYNLVIDLEVLPANLVTWSQMMFVYNIVARASFLLVAAIQANKDADANFNGDMSLRSLMQLMNK
jgi:hypothetical protein